MSEFVSTETMLKTINPTWLSVLRPEIDSYYFKELLLFLANEQKSYIIYPPGNMVFSWTHLTEFKDVKVVILGQDPYHGVGQAHGLSFSVPEPCKLPRTVANIYAELNSDITNFKIPEHGDLSNWAKQGVLLLNSVLTVRSSTPNSHKDKGWEQLTDAVMKALNKKKNVVFILWGKYAQKKGAFLKRNNHLIIQCAHPSPLSAQKGFIGSKCFSRTNEYLRSKDITEIDWNV